MMRGKLGMGCVMRFAASALYVDPFGLSRGSDDEVLMGCWAIVAWIGLLRQLRALMLGPN
jgi:hypothetical protein